MSAVTIEVSGRANGGPVVVLIPGIGGSAEHDFAFLLPMLARTRCVATVNFSGGEPAAASEFGVGERAEAVLAALDRVVPRQPLQVVGCSVGAAIAIRLAAASDRIVALALLAAVHTSTVRQRSLAAIWTSMSDHRSQDLRQLATVIGLGPVLDQQDIDAPRIPSPVPLNQLAVTDFQILANLDETESTQSVLVPTLIVSGTGDTIAGTEQGKLFFGSIANSRFVEIPAGHALLAECPALVLALVQDFLQRPEHHPAGSTIEAAIV